MSGLGAAAAERDKNGRTFALIATPWKEEWNWTEGGEEAEEMVGKRRGCWAAEEAVTAAKTECAAMTASAACIGLDWTGSGDEV